MNKRQIKKMVGIRNKKRMIEILDLVKIEDFEIEKLELRHDRFNNWDRCYFKIKSIPNWKFLVQLIGNNVEDCFGDYEPFIDKFSPFKTYCSCSDILEFIHALTDIENNYELSIVKSNYKGRIPENTNIKKESNRIINRMEEKAKEKEEKEIELFNIFRNLPKLSKDIISAGIVDLNIELSCYFIPRYIIYLKIDKSRKITKAFRDEITNLIKETLNKENKILGYDILEDIEFSHKQKSLKRCHYIFRK